MQTTMEPAGKHTVKLTVEVPPEEFAKDLDRTYRSIANSVKVPGFRKGKVPRRIIDAQIGRDAVLAEFIQDALPEYYSRAIREHQLAPIADPEIDLDDEELSEQKPLRFTATVEVRPRLELKPEDYMGVHVDLDPAVVEEEEVDRFVDRLRERFAELEPVGRPATKGDFVVMDLRTTIHGEELPEATREDHLYEVGSGEVVPKLDDELEGKRSGEILKFNETLPEGPGEHAGQEVSFTVLVKEVKAKKLPPVDDDFAKTASEFDTMEELREDLRAKLQEAKERQREQDLRDKVLQAMVDTVDVDLPDRLVDSEVEHRVAHAQERAEQIGATLDQVLEAQGWDELRFRSDARTHAIRAVKADLVLEAVARAEDLQVSPEELGAEVAALARAMNRDPREVARTLEKSGQITSLAGDIIRSKALDLLVEHAEVPGGHPLKRGTGPADSEPEASGEAETSEQGERDE
jgi:trigger factor